MIRNFKRTSAILGTIALSTALVACSDDAEDTANEATSEAEEAMSSDDNGDAAASGEGEYTASGELIGEGASSQQNAMDYFGVRYDELTDATLAYNPTGSGSGQTEFIAGTVDFAGSDSPLSDDQASDAADRCDGNEAWHLPMVIGPVAIAYNLEGVDDLNLSVETVASIFKGDITSWDDEAIAAENEDADLPDTDISVVYRSDESGTSDNFQKFLTSATGEWDDEGKQFPQGVGEGANGSNGVATQTSQIDGAITYVESGFADQNDLGVANLDFGSGPVELSSDTVGVALDNLTFETEGHNMVVNAEELFSADDEGSYPLILTTYNIVCSDGYEDDVETRLKDFFKVVLDSQNDELADSGYIPVSGNHLERLKEAVDAIGTGGE